MQYRHPQGSTIVGAFLQQQPEGNAKSDPSVGTSAKGCFSYEFEIQLVTDSYNFTKGKFTK